MRLFERKKIFLAMHDENEQKTMQKNENPAFVINLNVATKKNSFCDW